MFVQSLKSLVLNGVSVKRDGFVVGSRLGCGYLATLRTPEQPFPMLHASAEADTRDVQADQPPPVVNPNAVGTGRSLRSAGVLSPVTPTIIVGGIIPCGWRRARGGSSQTAVIAAMQQCIAGMTSVGETFATGLPVRASHSPLSAHKRRDWAKPAGRTPPASTRGQGS